MNVRIDRSTRMPILALFAVPFLFCSCAEDGRPKRFPATGKVLVDGKGAAGIKISLHPSDRPRDLDALHPTGVTDDQGTYRLGSYEQDDGAPAGTYKATLFWPDAPPGPGRPGDLFNGKYSKPESSGFELTIVEGANDLKAIEVAKGESPPKPRPGVRTKSASSADPSGADGDAPGSR